MCSHKIISSKTLTTLEEHFLAAFAAWIIRIADESFSFFFEMHRVRVSELRYHESFASTTRITSALFVGYSLSPLRFSWSLFISQHTEACHYISCSASIIGFVSSSQRRSFNVFFSNFRRRQPPPQKHVRWSLSASGFNELSFVACWLGSNACLLS